MAMTIKIIFIINFVQCENTQDAWKRKSTKNQKKKKKQRSIKKT